MKNKYFLLFLVAISIFTVPTPIAAQDYLYRSFEQALPVLKSPELCQIMCPLVILYLVFKFCNGQPYYRADTLLMTNRLSCKSPLLRTIWKIYYRNVMTHAKIESAINAFSTFLLEIQTVHKSYDYIRTTCETILQQIDSNNFEIISETITIPKNDIDARDFKTKLIEYNNTIKLNSERKTNKDIKEQINTDYFRKQAKNISTSSNYTYEINVPELKKAYVTALAFATIKNEIKIGPKVQSELNIYDLSDNDTSGYQIFSLIKSVPILSKTLLALPEAEAIRRKNTSAYNELDTLTKKEIFDANGDYIAL